MVRTILPHLDEFLILEGTVGGVASFTETKFFEIFRNKNFSSEKLEK